jgi:hypothetical protein
VPGKDDHRSAVGKVGLCATCRFGRPITSSRGAEFWQCGKALEDPAFPRYPRLPVVQCRGYEENEFAHIARPPD